jgi:hypothetical protein
LLEIGWKANQRAISRAARKQLRAASFQLDNAFAGGLR